MYKVTFLFGKEEIHKFLNGKHLTEDELKLNVIEIAFPTIEGAQAFVKGVEEGVGWTECLQLSENERKMLNI
jgi:hypothetical protein